MKPETSYAELVAFVEAMASLKTMYPQAGGKHSASLQHPHGGTVAFSFGGALQPHTIESYPTNADEVAEALTYMILRARSLR